MKSVVLYAKPLKKNENLALGTIFRTKIISIYEIRANKKMKENQLENDM